ncbi:GPN-loop GTPase 3 [Iris pallida]|uniref:GPN-loop GTPase 3 n=1 Tax=Iris pallida TaxID=29817 RepID=A0AAX6GK52_IRIPA|nr:GPN-loop GTPase 3 [Iris pallida]
MLTVKNLKSSIRSLFVPLICINLSCSFCIIDDCIIDHFSEGYTELKTTKHIATTVG